tara:strand:- start:216 stop:728 length:513 start_codon:yes stop_codon:yes gene_type:complete
MKILYTFLLLLFSASVLAAPAGDCEGTPEGAILELPSPLNNWGQIACTEYGHIITNMDGWIWSNPGAYSPVMIPSQMVRRNPEPVGNNSYFTKIEMNQLGPEESNEVIELFEAGFDSSGQPVKVYNLSIASISGRELSFMFLDYGESQWGMWCNNGCDPQSKFMLLDMEK